ncbi:hypothetical protein JNUCC0626_24565 [Lentzea sp. JNUCC 0626]|uniref:hypothetical protein n=1 Tax=Lentzea sp. JNUCC 0626 TaxID=3367513 RepID=UPI00374A15F0
MAAWVAAGIAIIAAAIAMSNANSAKTQAGAALKQAFEAKKAREAAEAQVVEAQKAASAAEQQVEIMRQTQADENADRHERGGPEFEVVEGKRAKNSRVVKVTMLSGPAVVWATPSWTVDSSHPETTAEHLGGIQSGQYEAQRLVKNTSFDIELGGTPTTRTPIVVEVHLHCTDDNVPGKTWDRVYSVTLKRPQSGGSVW